MGENGVITSPENSHIVPVEDLPETQEVEDLKNHFKTKYGEEPEFYVRVPGRVNLIGEHIDYCGYSVCPMAIEQHILLAIRASDDGKIKLTNIDSKYEEFTGELSDFTIDSSGAPKWHQYVLCGIRGALDKAGDGGAPSGLQMAIAGTIPPSSGLSSSSALVCAALIAAARICELPLDKKDIADLAAISERHIGTQGGGMDQAIALLANEGCAKLISFNPLASEDIILPPGAVFVVSNSLAEMNKAATADFNQRVVECRMCCYILAKRMRLDWRRYPNLFALQKAVGLGARHFRALATETLKEQPYTKRELCYELQISQEELETKCLTPNTSHLDAFKLKQRLMHVAQEVERVQEFIRLCKSCAEKKELPEAALWKLGNLLKKSHTSLRDLFECSHVDLDTIINLAERKTLGARLTGAGWGGCAVALTTSDKVDEYIETLRTEFYSNHENIGDKDIDTLVFPTKPGRGAVIYKANVN